MSNDFRLKNANFTPFETSHPDSFHHRETSAEDSDIAKKGHVVPTTSRIIKTITAENGNAHWISNSIKKLYSKLQ